MDAVENGRSAQLALAACTGGGDGGNGTPPPPLCFGGCSREPVAGSQEDRTAKRPSQPATGRRCPAGIRAAVRAVLTKTLPRDWRLMVILAADAGLTDAEVAAVLGMTPDQFHADYAWLIEIVRVELRRESGASPLSSPDSDKRQDAASTEAAPC